MANQTLAHTTFDPQKYSIQSFSVQVRGRLESMTVPSTGERCEIVIDGTSISIFGAAPKGLLIGAEYIVYIDAHNLSFEMISK